MSENLERAMQRAYRLKALLYALEAIATDIDIAPKDAENAANASSLFYMAGEVAADLLDSLEATEKELRCGTACFNCPVQFAPKK